MKANPDGALRSQPRVVTFGELMLRLSAPGHERFEQASGFEATFGGGEANVAASIARFGLTAAFVTRLPENPIGEMAARALGALGVDVGWVMFGGSRCGIYFLEHGAAQRPSRVVYDRAGSAFAEIAPGMIDWDRVFEGASWFHVTGITPALSRGSAEATIEAVEAAARSGVTVSIDLNYRATLWNWGQTPREVMSALVRHADVVIGNEEDAAKIFGLHAGGVDVDAGRVNGAAYEAVCRQLTEQFPQVRKVAVTVRGSVSASRNTWTGVLWQAGRLYTTRDYDILPIVDRVGSGDAFAAGLIWSLISDPDDPQAALDFAAAAGCLKHSVPGDFNRVSVDEVRRVAAGAATGRIVR